MVDFENEYHTIFEVGNIEKHGKKLKRNLWSFLNNFNYFFIKYLLFFY